MFVLESGRESVNPAGFEPHKGSHAGKNLKLSMKGGKLQTHYTSHLHACYTDILHLITYYSLVPVWESKGTGFLGIQGAAQGHEGHSEARERC